MPALSEIDADIERSAQTAAAHASRRKELQRKISENLGNGADKPARDAAAELRRLTDDLDFEEQRGRALRERRAAIEAEAASEKRAAKWAEVDALLAERSAVAKRIDKAIDVVGKSAAELLGLSRTIDQKLAGMRVEASFVADDVQTGIVYSLIGAGMPWVFPNGQDARVDGNRLTDRVSRTHAGLAALRLRSEGQEREAA
jgi:hypothetical protein